MSFFVDQVLLDKLKAANDTLTEQFAALQEGIDFLVDSDSPPFEVPWFDEERRDVLRQATILVYLASLDLACYPLSDSAVLFIEP